MHTTNKPFAEVIESSLHGWLAQSWEWDYFPSFGSLVSIEQKNRTLLGFVHQVSTGSMDPMRYPFPYKKTEAELLAEQPQIFEFLKTTFSCVIAGYHERGAIHYTLAPHPAKIHAFVQSPSPEIIREFFASDHYLHVLMSFASQIGSIDELLLAILSQQHKHSVISAEKLASIMQTYSLLIGNDYRRIKLFLARAHHSLS